MFLRTRRRLAGVPLLLATTASVGGLVSASSARTTSTASPTAAGRSGARLIVGVSVPKISPYYRVLYNEIKKELAPVGGAALQPAINNFQPAKQITDIRKLISAGADALYIVPANNEALAPALSYAKSKNVPVVVVDDQIKAGKVYINVRANNLLMAQQACMEIGTRLHATGKVLSLMGDQATTNGHERTVGFNECMQANFPKIEVIARPTQLNTTTAADAIRAVLTANPHLGGIYLQSETLFLATAISILKNKGKAVKVGQKGHVVLVGIDGTPRMLAAIRSGLADAVVSQPIPLDAKWGVAYLLDAKAQKTIKPGQTRHGSQITRAPAGNLTDLLPAPLVTKANVNDPSLWGNQATQ